jgi:hypothetical protein
MLDYLVKTAHSFENTHGTPPDVIYINPFHYECLCKQYPELFSSNQEVRLGL